MKKHPKKVFRELFFALKILVKMKFAEIWYTWIKRDDRAIIQATPEEGIFLAKRVFNIPLVCRYCKKRITVRNFGGLFNKPDRLCCKNILCTVECYIDGGYDVEVKK